MGYYTYPQAIDEFERRLLTAVNAFSPSNNTSSAAQVQFALFVDNGQGALGHRMRSEFVWEVMGSSICSQDVKGFIPLKHWVNWWRQRWQRLPQAPDFTGMYEHTRRGLVVQLARLATNNYEGAQTTCMQQWGATIRDLNKQGALSWPELAELSDCLLLSSCLIQASGKTPPPAFAVNNITWSFIWHAIEQAYPEHHALFSHFNTISASVRDFCDAIDCFLAAQSSHQGNELPDNLAA